MTDWEKTISDKRQALARAPPEDLGHLECLNSLAGSLWSIGFSRLHKLENLNEAIALYREVLTLQHATLTLQRAATLSYLASCLWTRFRKLSNVADIEEAVSRYREAVKLYPAEHPRYLESLKHLASSLVDHFKQLDALMDPDEYRSTALSLCPADFPEHHLFLYKLGGHFWIRFNETRNRGDLDNAVSCYRDVLTIYPAGHPEYLTTLKELASCIWRRFGEWNAIKDIEEAVECYRQLLALCLPGDSSHLAALEEFANIIWIKFRHSGSIKDLEETVMCYRQILAFYPRGHSNRSAALTNLGSAVWDYFTQLGKLGDLTEAIACQRELLELNLDDKTNCLKPLVNLAYYLWTRSKMFGKIEDLEEAISCYRRAIVLCSTDDSDYPIMLARLACAIWARFQDLGESGDLKEAILHFHKALGLKEHCNCSDCLDMLLNSVWMNFQQLGKISHRRSFVLHYCEVLVHYDSGSSDCCKNPGEDSIWVQFQVSSEESIIHYRSSLTSCSIGHYRHTVCLNDLADVLKNYFEKTKKIEYLIEAVAYYQEIVELCPIGNPHRPNALYKLTGAIWTRYLHNNAMEDLEELESLYESTLSCLSKEDPLAALIFCAQASLYIKKHEQIEESQTSSSYLNKAFCLLEKATNHHTTSVKFRFETAEGWSKEAHKYKHSSAISAYSQALLLQQQHLFLFPSVESQHKYMTDSEYGYKTIALNGASCAIEMGKLETAVEFLEQGRAILWSKLHGYRQSLDELEKIDSQLAYQFKTICNKLEHQAVRIEPIAEDPLQVESVSDSRIKLQRKLFEEWSQVLAKIRALKGFHNFLKPETFRNLQKAASAGPVIMINISIYHSDAIILIDGSSPVSLSLPDVTPITIGLFVEQLTSATSSEKPEGAILSILRGLWDDIVSSVKEQLDLLGIAEKSHIWWCPTSYLCALPLHAAGPYKKKQKNLPDIYISSYILTLTSLIKARSNIVKNQTIPSILVVGQPDNTIPQVTDEISQIRQTARSIVNVIVGEEVDKKRVLSELQYNPWVHFASHGYLNKQPFNSWFQLHDENLTVLDLATAQLHNAELAFLSACHSAAGDIHGTPDEVVHLAASLQFCGFRSVVGTLWAMVDDDGPTVAKIFYQHMFRNPDSVDFRDAAEALNLATRKLRRDGISLDRWINFVHIGA